MKRWKFKPSSNLAPLSDTIGHYIHGHLDLLMSKTSHSNGWGEQRGRPTWMKTFSCKHTYPDSQSFARPLSSIYTVLPISEIQILSFSAQFRCCLYPMTFFSLLCSSWNILIPIALYLVRLTLIPFTLYYSIVWTCLWSLLDYIFCEGRGLLWLIYVNTADPR